MDFHPTLCISFKDSGQGKEPSLPSPPTVKFIVLQSEHDPSFHYF